MFGVLRTMLLLLCLTVFYWRSVNCTSGTFREAMMSTEQICLKYGYTVETHHVTTEDGYVLALHRIPHGSTSPPAGNKTAVLLMHGLFQDSSNWLILGPDHGLGYLLADSGYDVWMGNNRGNTYSRKHKTLSPEQGEFWQFSWHEMGVYDCPAMIDHMLEHVNQTDMFYVGYSQGTTQFYVMGSDRPEYNPKIRMMFSLAPVAYMTHAESPMLKLLAMIQRTAGIMGINLQRTFDTLIGPNEFLPHSRLFGMLGYALCASPIQAMCSAMINRHRFVERQHGNQATALSFSTSHYPAGASSRNVCHYVQLVNVAEFAKYDFPTRTNMRHYGQSKPPAYDVSKITCPMSFHYSSNDWLVATQDVKKLYAQLTNKVGLFLVPDDTFNHLDFVVSKRVKEILYDKLLSIMNSA